MRNPNFQTTSTALNSVSETKSSRRHVDFIDKNE
ncbi:hypothetical protein RSUY_41820 (plasmid) [Ralstonia solanacearum]|nr:hypothetical protein RSUY_41820 [Ralstonia solanacearum]